MYKVRIGLIGRLLMSENTNGTQSSIFFLSFDLNSGELTKTENPKLSTKCLVGDSENTFRVLNAFSLCNILKDIAKEIDSDLKKLYGNELASIANKQFYAKNTEDIIKLARKFDKELTRILKLDVENAINEELDKLEAGG